MRNFIHFSRKNGHADSNYILKTFDHRLSLLFQLIHLSFPTLAIFFLRISKRLCLAVLDTRNDPTDHPTTDKNIFSHRTHIARSLQRNSMSHCWHVYTFKNIATIWYQYRCVFLFHPASLAFTITVLMLRFCRSIDKPFIAAWSTLFRPFLPTKSLVTHTPLPISTTIDLVDPYTDMFIFSVSLTLQLFVATTYWKNFSQCMCNICEPFLSFDQHFKKYEKDKVNHHECAFRHSFCFVWNIYKIPRRTLHFYSRSLSRRYKFSEFPTIFSSLFCFMFKSSP